MKTKEITLSNHWTLIVHETLSVFVSIENPNKFSILDWDDDQTIILTTDESSVEVQGNRYGAKHKVDLSNRTFTFFLEPDEE